jgi:hypothetical protein
LGLDTRVGTDPGDFMIQNSPTGIIYDKFEFSVVPTGPFINLTQVDFFCLPVKITCGSDSRGFYDGITRQEIFNDYLAAKSGDWQKLLLTNSTGTQLRILNPGKIAPTDTSFGTLINYFDNIINEYWAAGNSVTMLYVDGTTQITGTSDGTYLNFGSYGTYLKPTTINVFGQAQVDTVSNILMLKIMTGAINRGVIKNPNVDDQGNSTKYYDVSAQYNNGLYNYYAQFIHRPKYCIGGLAYALAFDDCFGQDSGMNIPNQGSITVQLQPFQ